MKKTMKKALAIVLAIFMVVSTIPMVLATDDPSTIITDEAGLQTALEAGGEYTLGNDVILTDAVYHSYDVTTVIDMNGYKIGDIPWSVVVQAGDLTIYGGRFNGVLPIASSGSLTVRDVTIDATSSSATQNSGGKLTLENVTINGPYSDSVYAPEGETVIIGGSYTCGEDNEIISYYDTIPDVKIYGGTFSKSVADYVADGYTEVEKDGKFVVESNMKGTAGEGITWIIDYFGTLTISGTGAIVVDWYSPPWKEYNDLIKNVVIEEGITEVSDTAFDGAENLVTVSLPSTLTYISGWAFYDNYALEEINVAEANTAYKSIDGILFTEDEKTLVAYPMNKASEEYTIPASVTTIGEMAFVDCVAVDKVIVPDTVTTLADHAFAYSQIKEVEIGNGVKEYSYDCFNYSRVEKMIISDSVETISQYAFSSASRLHTVIIGSGIETINEESFNNTSSLKIIHYKGTQEDWDDISINEDNADLNSKTLHFLSADAYKAEVAPTCADGHTAGYYCNDCEAYLTGEVIPAVDEHTPGESVEENVIAPTCDTAGSKDVVVYCSVCDGEVSRTPETIDETGHTPGESVEENVIAPTCDTAGSKDVVTYCTVCGEESSRETLETAEALDHDWNNGVCGTCGETCTHIDADIDEICDECEAEFPMEEAMLDETNTVYIPTAHEAVIVKFTPSETGEYVIVSDNGGNDDEIDPYVEIYNSNGDEIESDDDSDYEDTYNFYCEFEAEAGETYYIKLYAYESDVEYDYVVRRNVRITHQPTTDEPYVELSWDVDADYQWYSIEEKEKIEITDENAEGRYADDVGHATYDEEYGWSGAPYDDYQANYFQIELEAGQTVEMIPDMDVDCLGIWSNDGNRLDCEDVLAGESVYFTADTDDTYFVYTDGNIDAHIRAYLTSYEYTAINGETDSTLKNPEIGTKYACKVTLEDDSVLTSDILEYNYAITHQPTADEPYVELNDDTDATYQWYSVVDNSVEITEENADALNYDWGTSSYNAETGWSGVSDGFDGNGQDFFTVSLEAGDTVMVELTGDYYSGVGLWDYDVRDGVWIDSTDATSYELTAEWDGDYTFYTYQEEDGATVYVKAYIVDREYTAIDGATDSVYAPTEEGLYACEVTFADGTTEMSDMFEGPHIHDDSDDDAYCDGCDELLDPSVECDHNCHKGGIAGFFWKIARFFNKLFGLNKYCECGVAHY